MQNSTHLQLSNPLVLILDPQISVQRLSQTVTIARSSPFNIGYLRMSPPPKSLGSFTRQRLLTCGRTMLSFSLQNCVVSSGVKPNVWVRPLCTWSSRPSKIIGMISGPKYKLGAKIAQQSSLSSTSRKNVASQPALPSRLSFLLRPAQYHLISCTTQHAC